MGHTQFPEQVIQWIAIAETWTDAAESDDINGLLNFSIFAARDSSGLLCQLSRFGCQPVLESEAK